MRIAFVSFDEVPSFKGASAHILSGLRAATREHEVHLLTLGERPLRPASGIRHHVFPIREQNLLARGLRFRELVEKRVRLIRPDIVHFRSPWEGIPIVRAGIPTVYEVNGLPSVELPYHYRAIPERVLEQFREWERECLHSATAIICPSSRIRTFVSGLAPETSERIRVLPNAFDPLPKHFELAARPGIFRTRPAAVVYLGTLTSWQGLLWSLKAFEGLGHRYHLDLYLSSAKRSARLLDRRVRRLGLEASVSVREPLTRSRMMRVLPTYDLGFAPFLKTRRNVEQGCCPLKLLDYLAHGLPVLASDLHITHQFVTGGKNGILFPPNSIRLLRETLSSIAENPSLLTTLRPHAAPSLLEHPTWDDYGTTLLALYHQLVAAESPRRRSLGS